MKLSTWILIGSGALIAAPFVIDRLVGHLHEQEQRRRYASNTKVGSLTP